MRASIIRFLFCTLVFGVAHTQAPLFYSNQNQYFLHGLAWAGFGHLDRDWLAGTADPTPIFSGLVAVTYRFFDLSLFHVYYLLWLGLYAFTLWNLFSFLTGLAAWSPAGLCFFTLLVFVHAGALRLVSVFCFGMDYPWFLQAGLANQYILGPGMQPSVAGVVLLVSLATFAENRPWLAVALLSLAATLHSTYLLGAAMLTAAYMIAILRERGPRQAALLGGLALLLVLPVVIYNAVTFAPTSAGEFDEAQSILAHFRIPHHVEIDRWLDAVAWLQMGWIALAIVLVRDQRLRIVLIAVSGQALALTLIQLATASDTLALLFPWRISAVLMPAATAIILARLAQVVSHRRAIVVCSTALFVLVCGGIAIQFFGLAYRMSDEDLPLLNFVGKTAEPGDVHMIPVKKPAPPTSRGSPSASFLPPPRMKEKTEFIAVDLQRFRTLSGAALFVDFKAIPYRDVEVLEWKRRFDACEAWYADPGARPPPEGVTHVIVPGGIQLSGPGFTLVREDQDSGYRLYRARRKQASNSPEK